MSERFGEAVVAAWTDGPLPRDARAAIERLARSDDVRRIAVMPDVHLSADVCVGTVVATSRSLYPNAVGGDIGCGVAAVAFDCAAAELDDPRRAAAILAGLYREIPLVRHRRDCHDDIAIVLGEHRVGCCLVLGRRGCRDSFPGAFGVYRFVGR